MVPPVYIAKILLLMNALVCTRKNGKFYKALALTEKEEQMDITNLDNLEQYEALVTMSVEYGMRVLSALLILIAGWVIGSWTSKRVHKIPRLDPMLATFLGGLVKYIILAVAVVMVLGQFGVQTASLLAVLGAAGLAIGLALQGTLSNVAAGVMLLILRPFKVGDYIQFNGNGGTVISLGLFTTELATPDNIAIFAPNSAIWGAEVYNYNRHKFRRQDIAAGISYEDDIGKAITTIQKVLDEHPMVIHGNEDKAAQVLTSNMGESSIDFIVRFWTATPDYWNAKWEITKQIKEALDSEGISIPFPCRTLYMVNNEAEKSSNKEAA
jgi:small conductance mechanosensitive channel